MDAKRATVVFFFGILFIGFLGAASALPACPTNQVCMFYGLSLEKSASQKSFPTSNFQCPASAAITVPFTSARTVNGQTRPHQGIDMNIPVGTAVKAAANGKVTQTPTDYSDLGTVIIVRHSDNPKVETTYGHLQSSNVRPGDTVKKGDTIGFSGSSGQGTDTPSLYFELRRDGKPSSEVEDICKGAYMASAQVATAQTPPTSIKPSTSGTFEVKSRSEFQTSQIVLAGIERCVKATEATCPQIATASYKGRTWRTADNVCIYKATSGIYHVPYSLLKADMNQESGGRQFAESAYAQGYAQLVPETAAGMGIGPDKVFDPYYNICGGVEYLARQLKTFGSVECALAAYNAGPYEKSGTVQSRDAQACTNHPYGETRNYVRSISAAWDRAMASG